MKECMLAQIRPEGWLRQVLLAEKNGMPGHLPEIGYPYDRGCWAEARLTDGGYAEWWPYEQTAYWIDSMVRLAALLRDDEVYALVMPQIRRSLALAAPDGFIGPEELKGQGRRNQWPHAVYFRALTALWSATGDEAYLEAIARHYKTHTSGYTMFREVVNTETMLNTAAWLGDEELREMAFSAYETFNRESADNDSSVPALLSEKNPYQHGVTYNEQAKLGALFAMHGGGQIYLDAAVHAYEKIDRWHMLPDGVHSSCEFTLGNDSLKAHETCDIADYTWSLGYLLMATGDGKYADKIERAVFNAAFGAIGPEFRSIQYFCSPNLVRAARNSTHIESFGDTPRFAYQPHHYPECCVGNVGRIFPNYAARMFMEGEEGVYLPLYGAGVYQGAGFTLTESGTYPFTEQIHVRVAGQMSDGTALYFRIPGWCRDFALTVNGRTADCRVEKQFARLAGPFADGDEITLNLPMALTVHDSADGGIYFDYGPFLLALPIAERWVCDDEEKRQTAAFPAWRVTPESDWNYAVTGALDNAVIRRGLPDEKGWWGTPPLSVELPARRLEGWKTIRREIVKKADAEEKLDDKMVELGAAKIVETLELTPPLPDAAFVRTHAGEACRIQLVPFGFTHLRIAVFPKFSED